MIKDKLKGRMKERRVTYQRAAEQCGCGTGTMINKLNGRTTFTVNEMFALMSLLDLNAEDIREYFYDSE